MGLLQDSIRSEMVTDVPLGSFISGGVDSSLIAVIANSFNKVDPYTKGTHSKLDESKYAKMVANRSNFKKKSMFRLQINLLIIFQSGCIIMTIHF